MSEFASPAPLAPLNQIPLTFGQILDRIYRLTRSNLKLFVGIAAVPAGTCLLILALFSAVVIVPIVTQAPEHPDPGALLRAILPSIFIVMLLNMAVFALYLAASIHAASQANQGLKITCSAAYGFAWKRGGHYLWLLFLAYLIAFLPMLVIEMAMIIPMGVFAAGKTSPVAYLVYMIPLEMLLFLGASVYGVIMALRLSLAFPASVAEGLTARAAIRRSGQLTQGAKGRIFLVLLVIYALGYAAEMVVVMVLAMVFGLGALALALLHIQLTSAAGVIGAGLGAVGFLGFIFLWIALFWAAFSTAFAVLYQDQRLRMEGPLPAPAPAGEPA